MVVTIHQPDFLPWLGFFDRWAKSDLYIVLDDVQFLRKGWHNRDKIKTAAGTQWLTLPTIKKGKYDQLINQVELNNQENWQRKHLGLIKSAYAKAPNFKEVFDIINRVYSDDHSKMIDLNMTLLREFASELDINVPYKFSSQFDIKSSGTRRLVDLATQVGADVYLTGLGSKSYLEEKEFLEKGISVQWQEFEPFVYEQLHGEFVPMLSILDFLMMRSV